MSRSIISFMAAQKWVNVLPMLGFSVTDERSGNEVFSIFKMIKLDNPWLEKENGKMFFKERGAYRGLTWTTPAFKINTGNPYHDATKPQFDLE